MSPTFSSFSAKQAGTMRNIGHRNKLGTSKMNLSAARSGKMKVALSQQKRESEKQLNSDVIFNESGKKGDAA